MANIPQIQSNQSTATTRAPTPIGTAPVFMATRAPTFPTQQISASLQKLSTLPLLAYNTEIPKYYLRVQIAQYDREDLFRLGQLNPLKNIILPLPLNLIDAHNVSYGEEQLGQINGPVADVINSILRQRNAPSRVTPPMEGNIPQSTAGLIRNGLAQFGVGAGDLIGTAAGTAIGALTGGAVGTGAGFLAGSNLGITNPIRAFAGLTANQFLTILLQGPRYKTFTFSWQFAPKDASEAKRLNQVIRDFNNYMSPGLAAGGALFTFPAIFKLALYPNSQFLFKFKPAVLTSFTVDFSGSGQPSFMKASATTDNLNSPSFINMAMSFTQMEYELYGDFKDNNDPDDFDNTQPSSSDFNVVPNAPPGPADQFIGPPG